MTVRDTRHDPAVRNGEIDPISWADLHRADWPVLWCRRCAARGHIGEMYADGPAHEGPHRVIWYEATCRQCGLTVAMPNGRLAATDTRRPKATAAAAPAYTPGGTP